MVHRILPPRRLLKSIQEIIISWGKVFTDASGCDWYWPVFIPLANQIKPNHVEYTCWVSKCFIISTTDIYHFPSSANNTTLTKKQSGFIANEETGQHRHKCICHQYFSEPSAAFTTQGIVTSLAIAKALFSSLTVSLIRNPSKQA